MGGTEIDGPDLVEDTIDVQSSHSFGAMRDEPASVCRGRNMTPLGFTPLERPSDESPRERSTI